MPNKPSPNFFKGFRLRSFNASAARRRSSSPQSRRRMLRAELLEDRRLLAADVRLAADINLLPGQGSNPQDIVEVGNVLYFSADDGIVGSELWRFDTLTKQAELALDLPSGSGGSNPSSLTEFAGDLYFSARDTTIGFFAKLHQFHVQDGVSGVIGDPTLPPYGASSILAVGDEIYFFGENGGGLTQLWSYAPSTDELSLLANDANGSGLIESRGDLYFTARDSENDTELWKYDIGLGQVSQVTDIMAGSGRSVSGVIAFDQKLYFSADDGTSGLELWVYDPNANGGNGAATLAADINLGSTSSSPGNFIALGGALYFTANDGTHGRQLWKFDPAANNGNGSASLEFEIPANPSAQIQSPGWLTSHDGKVLMVANSGASGFEFWQFDPSANNGAGAGILLATVSGPRYPQKLTATDSGIYFNAEDPQSGRELFVLALNTPPVAENDNVEVLKNTPTIIDVLADNGNGVDTDPDGDTLTVDSVTQPLHGTALINADNTVTYEPAQDYFGPDQFTYTIADGFGGTDTATVNVDVISLPELVIQDVTVEEGNIGRKILIFQVDIIGEPTRSVSVEYATADGTATLADNDYESTGGTLSWDAGDNSSRFIPVEIFADEAYESDEDFTVTLYAANNAEILSSITVGTIQNDDAPPKLDLDLAPEFSIVSFSFPEAAFNPRVVYSDGSTVLVIASNSATSSTSTPWSLWKGSMDELVFERVHPDVYTTDIYVAIHGGNIFFNTRDGAYAASLDGGTPVFLGNFVIRSDFVTISDDGFAYFVGADAFGEELWKTDGTLDGSSRVYDVVLGPGSGVSGPLMTLDGTIFFRGGPNPTSRSLWKSSGTEAGTLLVRADIYPGPSHVVVNGQLYFNGFIVSPSSGAVFRTDGSAAGTQKVFDSFAENGNRGDALPEVFDLNGQVVIVEDLQLSAYTETSFGCSSGRFGEPSINDYRIHVLPSDASTPELYFDSANFHRTLDGDLSAWCGILEIYPTPSSFGQGIVITEQVTSRSRLVYIPDIGSSPVVLADIPVSEVSPNQVLDNRLAFVSDDDNRFGASRGPLALYSTSVEGDLVQFDIELSESNAIQFLDKSGRLLFFAQDTLYAVVGLPEAHLPTAIDVDEGDFLELNAYSAYDPEDAIVMYEWDLDYDGMIFDVNSEGVTINVDATNGPASFMVALRVTDKWGQSSIASTQVTVHNTPPIIQGIRDLSTPLGSSVDFSASISDSGTEDTFSILWELGDVNNTVVEDNSSFSYTYEKAGEYYARVYVTDSDGESTVKEFRVVVGPPVTVTASAVQIDEGQGVTLNASLDAALLEDVVIPLTYSGTGLDGIDFAATVLGGIAPTQILIPAGLTSGSIEIFNLQDAIDEHIETLTISLGVPSNASLASHDPIRVDLLDDDAEPTVFISSTPQVINEGDLALPLTVSLSEVSGRDVVVSLVTGGTAQLESDYQIAENLLVIPAGQTQVSTTLTILDDELGEGAEQISVTIDVAQNAVTSLLAAAPNKVTHVISANDAPTVQFATALERVSETAGPHEILVTLSNPSDTPITIDYSLSGDATFNQDYAGVATSGTLAFPAFSTGQSIDLNLLNDSSQEDTETIVAAIQNPTGAILGATSLHATQIIDDESLRVTLVASDRSVWEDAGYFTVTASLNSEAPAGGFSVPVSFSGTAIEGTHYFAESDHFAFSGGETSKTLTFILADDDGIYEANRTVNITAAKPTEATLANDKLVVNILDNEAYVSLVRVAGSRLVGAKSTAVDEGTSTAKFTAYLDRPTNKTVIVNLTTKGITAERSDYYSPTPSLTIHAGSTSATGTVGITNDGILEATETLRVSISSANNALLNPMFAARQFEIAIRDNDSPPIPYWEFAGGVIREADTPIVILKVSLARAAETTFYADFSVSGTAAQNEDYVINGLSTAQGRVQFDPGEREKFLAIAIVDDGHHEDLETIDLHLDTGGARAASFTILLNDNDAKPREQPKRKWYEKWGDEISSAGRSINEAVNDAVDYFDRVIAIPPADLASGGTASFEDNGFYRHWRYAVISMLFDGYVDNATIFVDYNFNESLDYVDCNGDGLLDALDLVESTFQTDHSGQFQVSIPLGADQNLDGLFSLDEGQLVAIGGTDISLNAESSIPMTAPLTYPTVSPLSTLVAKLRLATGDAIGDVESRVAAGLSLTSSNYLRADLISLANQEDAAAADAFATSVQVYATVKQIASFASGLESTPSVRLAGSVAFTDIASKLASESALVDFTEPVVIKSILLGTLNRLGIEGVAIEALDAATEVVVAGNQSIVAPTGNTGRERLEAIVRAQSVSMGAASEAMTSLASGAISAAEVVAELTGASRHALIQDAIIGNVVAPYLVADDVQIIEGNDGTKLAVFNVGITSPSNLPVTVNYATSDFSAIAGEDYQSVAGQLTWAPGETTVHQIQVPIFGDTLSEADERFHLLLTNAVNAAVLETVSYGDIISDDAAGFAPADNSIDHSLVLDVDGTRMRLFDNGSVAFEGVYEGGQEFVINSVDGLQNDLTVVIQPDSVVTAGGIRFIGNGAASSLTIDASFATSIEHIQYSDGNGRFIIDNAVLRYENVGSISSSASAQIVGTPLNELGYGETLSLNATPSSLFDPNELTSESWTVYRNDIVISANSGNEVELIADEVGVYRVTYTATQDGRLPSIGSYEFTISNAPPVASDDSFMGEEDSFMSVPAAEGLLANDADELPEGMRVTSVEGQAINEIQPFEFASAALDPSIAYLASSINDTNFYGVRFEVTETIDVDRVGGNFQFVTGSGPFAAIVQLDSGTDLPDSVNLSTPDVLATTLVPLAFQQDGDKRGDLDITLEPGWYALMFGTGKFGSTGITNMLLNNEPSLTPNDYLHARVAVPEYFPISQANPTWKARFVLEGTTAQSSAITLDSGAIVTVSPDGSFTYDPNGQFEFLAFDESVNDSFVYTVTDSEGLTAQATATITVQGANDAPVAQDDSYLVSEESLLSPGPSVGVLVNDSDVDGDVLTLTQANGQPFTGEIRLTSGATVTSAAEANRFIYNPRTAFNYLTTGQTATDSFTYQITDESGATSTATVSITINGWDDAPVAGDDTFVVSEESLLSPVSTVGLLANDNDPEGTTLSVTAINGQGFTGVITLPSGATIEPSAETNRFIYDPRGAFNYLISGATGTDSFSYLVTDATGKQATATATITINGVDDTAVISGATQFSTGEDTDIISNSLSIVDPDLGQAFLVPQSKVIGAYGAFSITASGVWTYDLDNAVTNLLTEIDSPTETFVVHSLDGSASRTIEITIIGGADADTDGVDDSIESAIGDGNGDGVPDSEQDNVASLPNAVTSSAVTLAVANGTTLVNVIASDPRLLAEQPPANVELPIGLLQFTVLVDSGAAATVRLYYDAAEPVNAIYKFGPVDGGAPGYYVLEDVAFGIDAFGHSYVDLQLVDGGAGDVDGTANGRIVDPVGLALVAGVGDDYVATHEDQSLTFNPLVNDVLVTPITIDTVSSALFGSVQVNADGTITYLPLANFFGSDVFEYRVSDANGLAGTATVFVTVLPVNDAPTILVTATDNYVLEGSQASASGTFSDIDPSSTLQLSASVGGVVGNGDGTWSWTYSPADGRDDSQTVVISVSDGFETTSTEFTLIVANEPVSFEAGTDAALVPVDEGHLVRTGIPFIDPGADQWSGTVDFGDGTGEQALFIDAANKTFDLNHVYTSEGMFTVTVRLKDDDSDYISDSFKVSVILNQPPVAHDDTLVISEEASTLDITGSLGDMGFGLLGNDSDPDGDSVTIVAIDTATISKGILRLNAGVVTFSPNGEFESLGVGESTFQTFTYTIADPSGETSTAAATIQISGVNDAPTITVVEETVSVFEGQAALNQGSIGDFDASDVVSLTATIGAVVNRGDGSWSWSWDTQDGPMDSAQVTIAASDGRTTTTASFELVVVNRAPEFQKLTTNANSLEFRSSDGMVRLVGQFEDAGLLDTHIVTVDWGDGSAASISVDQVADSFSGQHVYARGGIFTILVMVTDSDGAVAEATTHAVVQGVGVVDRTLYIIGTDQRDHVILKLDDKKNELEVDVKLSQGKKDTEQRVKTTIPANSIDRVVALLFDGDDHYDGKIGDDKKSSDAIEIRQLVFGGAGKDHLDGGVWNDALFGGHGDDDINADSGADILVGGGGSDKLNGGRGNDLLIGGLLNRDFNDVALINEIDSLLANWSSGQLTTRSNVEYYFGPIIDDEEEDDLKGEQDDDLLIEGLGDKLNQ